MTATDLATDLATNFAADQAPSHTPDPVQDFTHGPDDSSCAARQDPSRRSAMVGMAVAVGAFCAACSSSKSSSAAAGNTPAASGSNSVAAGSPSPGGSSSSSDTSGAASSSSTGSAGSSSSSGSTGSSSPLAATADVPVGGGKINTDQLVVVTQPTAGVFKAFTAVCTHQGCTVASVDGGLIHCPCHGSAFNIADGSVANGPAHSPLDAVAIKVSGGEITKA